VTRLVLKDLRVLRPWWWLIVPGHMLFAANGVVSPELFFGMNAALAWSYTAILIVVDWTQGADRFLASLPVSRGDVVKARYAGALGAAVIGTLLYAVYGRVILTFATGRLRDRWADAAGWEAPVGLFAFFLTVWLVSAAYLPFYFRWGLGKGTWLFLAGLTLPIALVAALIQGRHVPSAGVAVSVVVGLAVAAALGRISLELSVRSYAGRDL
jgi:hypothetical protein